MSVGVVQGYGCIGCEAMVVMGVVQGCGCIGCGGRLWLYWMWYKAMAAFYMSSTAKAAGEEAAPKPSTHWQEEQSGEDFWG